MKNLVFSLLMAFAAAPTHAQDLLFYPDPVLDCMDDAPETAMRYICIGTAANYCMVNTPGGSSTPVMGACLDRERAFWDARLNEVYARLLTQHAETPAVLDNLRTMQRAWITYRDARCDYEFVQWNGGTGGGPALLACLMRTTAEQTLLLEEQLR
jgi:uncharacterized protein YecT (DUF1311 family)